MSTTRRRRSYEAGHKPKWLVVIDDTPECDRAVYFAARRAARVGAGVIMLRVIETHDRNQQWLGVADIMKAEAHEEANAVLDKYSTRANGIAGVTAERVVREGATADEILGLIEEDEDIAILVLAAGTDKDGRLKVISGSPTPPGWAGKVWAMQQGLDAAADTDYILFTDADIGYAQGTLARLVESAGDRALVSQMALLRCESAAERLLIPAFVYFFAQLYPFRRVSSSRDKAAAAAGGCMLVRREALIKAGGLHEIRGARIDDVALGTLLKRAGHDTWLGFTTDVTSRRPYDFTQVWNMVARSAYTQLSYSPALLAGTVIGLAWLYLLPPAATLAGLALLPNPAAIALAGLGAAAWTLMSITYLPMLRLNRLNPLRAPTLPLIAGLYVGMTISSARRHRRGQGGEWKGRYSNAAGGGQAQTRLRSP